MIICALSPRACFFGGGPLWFFTAILPYLPKNDIPWQVYVPAIWGLLTLLALLFWAGAMRRRDKLRGGNLEQEQKLDDDEQAEWINEWARKQKEKKDKKKKK